MLVDMESSPHRDGTLYRPGACAECHLPVAAVFPTQEAYLAAQICGACADRFIKRAVRAAIVAVDGPPGEGVSMARDLRVFRCYGEWIARGALRGLRAILTGLFTSVSRRARLATYPPRAPSPSVGLPVGGHRAARGHGERTWRTINASYHLASRAAWQQRNHRRLGGFKRFDPTLPFFVVR